MGYPDRRPRIRIYPFAETYEQHVTRGEMRLAAEALLARMSGALIPHIVHDRAVATMRKLAR